MSNQKTPTTILLTPDRKFHSFGYAARDFYHDLDPSEAKQWLYLEKFKMKLHTTAVRTHTHTHTGNAGEVVTCRFSSLIGQNLSITTDLHAANGKRVKALDIFAYALAFFKEQALKVRLDGCCMAWLTDRDALVSPVHCFTDRKSAASALFERANRPDCLGLESCDLEKLFPCRSWETRRAATSTTLM